MRSLCRVEIQPGHNKDADKKAAQEIADFIKQVFDDMEGSFDTKLIEMLSALVFGFSCAEKIFSLIDYSKFQGKDPYEDLKFLNPEGFDFHTDPFVKEPLSRGGVETHRPLPAEKFVIYSIEKSGATTTVIATCASVTKVFGAILILSSS